MPHVCRDYEGQEVVSGLTGVRNNSDPLQELCLAEPSLSPVAAFLKSSYRDHLLSAHTLQLREGRGTTPQCLYWTPVVLCM